MAIQEKANLNLENTYPIEVLSRLCFLAAIAAYGLWFCPNYTRISGYVGGHSIR